MLVLLVKRATLETGVEKSCKRPRDQLLVAPAAVLTEETGVEKSCNKLRE